MLSFFRRRKEQKQVSRMMEEQNEIFWASRTLAYSLDQTRRLYGPSPSQVNDFDERDLDTDDSGTDESDEEVVIAVMGLTGSGKTTFIKSVTGCSTDVGEDLFSDTSELKGYPFSHKGINYLLVDTPGFNDTFMNNKDVTQKILTWLESSFGEGSRLHGIIIIHDISQRRLQGSATSKNLRFFRQLIQGDPCLSVTLATSFWDTVDVSRGESRERELMQSKDFWADMVAKGSEVVRIQPSRRICLQVLELAGKKAKLAQAANNSPIDHAYNLRASEAEEDARVQKYKAELAQKKELEREDFRRQMEDRRRSHKREMAILRTQTEQQLQEQARALQREEEKQRRQNERELKEQRSQRKRYELELEEQRKKQKQQDDELDHRQRESIRKLEQTRHRYKQQQDREELSRKQREWEQEKSWRDDVDRRLSRQTVHPSVWYKMYGEYPVNLDNPPFLYNGVMCRDLS